MSAGVCAVRTDSYFYKQTSKTKERDSEKKQPQLKQTNKQILQETVHFISNCLFIEQNTREIYAFDYNVHLMQ